MSTNVFSQPSISHRGRRKLLLAALAIVVAVGVAGAVTVARSSGGTSGGHAIRGAGGRECPTSLECGVDVEYLAAEVGTMPESRPPGSHGRVVAQDASARGQGDREPDRRRHRGFQFGFPYSPPVPDGPTLARVLAAIPAADARAVVSGLSPERRAEIGATSLTASPTGMVCP